MRSLVLYPSKILREETEVIKKVDEKLLKDIEELKEVLLSEKSHAAGLAAPQIGLSRRMFGQLSGNKKELKVFINPRILATYGTKTRPMMTFDDGTHESFLEGCLSFPDLFGTVKRFLKIEVEWEEIDETKPATAGRLKTQKSKLEGVEAIVFQHETDHLDGILFVDHILEEGGELFRFVGDKKMKWAVEKVIEVEKK